LPELALDGEPQELEPVGKHDEWVRAAASERRTTSQPVDRLAGGGQLATGSANPLERGRGAGSVKRPLPRRILGPELIDADAQRVSQDGLRMGVELGGERLEPPGMPHVVVARPCVVGRRRKALTSELEGSPPAAHQSEPALVSLIRDAGIELGIPERDLLRAVDGAIVDDYDREIVPRLGEQRLDRLGEVLLPVVGGQAEDGAGKRVRGIRTHGEMRVSPVSEHRRRR
jgi:hypothetical protein